MNYYHPTISLSNIQKVLMYSGEVKSFDKLTLGDQLMGPDSSPRTVVAIKENIEETYEIRPIKGESFILSLSQKLHLVKAGSVNEENYNTLKIESYLKLTQHFRGIHLLYRTPIEFNAVSLPSVEPYFMGVLIGDGCFMHSTPNITTPDAEIVECIFNTADQMKLKVRIEQIPGNQANRYHFSCPRSYRNPLTTTLKELGLHGKKSEQKFIPNIYKYGSKEVRSAILAGLLDTDGYMLSKTFEYCTASKQLAEDVAFIAQSLGLMALPKEKVVNGKTYYRFCVYGDFKDIPIRVARKIPGIKVRNRHVLRTGFTVHPIGMQPSFKIVLEGNDALYLKSDLMVMQGEQA